jgi:hypothetical protein
MHCKSESGFKYANSSLNIGNICIENSIILLVPYVLASSDHNFHEKVQWHSLALKWIRCKLLALKLRRATQIDLFSNPRDEIYRVPRPGSRTSLPLDRPKHPCMHPRWIRGKGKTTHHHPASHLCERTKPRSTWGFFYFADLLFLVECSQGPLFTKISQKIQCCGRNCLEGLFFGSNSSGHKYKCLNLEGNIWTPRISRPVTSFGSTLSVISVIPSDVDHLSVISCRPWRYLPCSRLLSPSLMP